MKVSFHISTNIKIKKDKTEAKQGTPSLALFYQRIIVYLILLCQATHLKLFLATRYFQHRIIPINSYDYVIAVISQPILVTPSLHLISAGVFFKHLLYLIY